MANPETINVTDARYFPITNSYIFIGRVLIISIVPRFLSLAIMKRFKNYFDPKGIMNPGKMFIR